LRFVATDEKNDFLKFFTSSRALTRRQAMRALIATSQKTFAVLTWIGCTAAAMSAFGQGHYPNPGVYQASAYQAPVENGMAPVQGLPPSQASKAPQTPQSAEESQESCDGPMGGLFSGLCDPNRCEPCWHFAAEAILLQRSTSRSQPLFYADDGQTQALNAQTFNFPSEAGPKLSAIRRNVWGDFDLEVAYFQVDGFNAQRSIPGASYMVLDGNGNTFNVTGGEAQYKSALYSGEVNLRWQWLGCVTLLGGFRMAQLNEHYLAYGTGAVDPVYDELAVNAFNHLFGGQIGAEMEVYNMGGPLQINALCKAGVFGNFAEYNIRRLDTGYTAETLNSTRSNHTAFLGEAGVTATYAVTERLAFRASASAVWIEGIALAPEQIGATNFTDQTAAIDTNGGVFYVGGGLGIEYRF
jgi:hypothetical protein